MCDKAFKRKYNLTVHKRTHLKKTSNPFKCELCGQTFNQKSNMKRHILVRHEKPARCSACLKRFSSQSEFDTHLAAKHPGQSNITMQILAVNSRCCVLSSLRFVMLSFASIFPLWQMRTLRSNVQSDCECHATPFGET